MLTWFKGHFPPGQFARYLVVGMVNTAFGYGTYALFTFVLTPHMPFAYVMAGIISVVTNVTFSFLNYKWFIFKTKGNYIHEWLRSFVVYGGGILIGPVLLPTIVFGVNHVISNKAASPYLAGAILTCLSAMVSFLGHKNFSFRVMPD